MIRAIPKKEVTDGHFKYNVPGKYQGRPVCTPGTRLVAD
jgi:hypothetical protein